VKRRSILCRVAAFSVLAHAGQALAFADEEHDWGISATRDIRQAPYSAPTPLEAPGARTATTETLKQLLATFPSALLLDVAAGEAHVSLKGARWLPNAGRGVHYVDLVQADTADRLRILTGGDKTLPLIFFCVNARCWLSYNASLRAAALGYSQVYWYRGGIEAWREAGFPLEPIGNPAPDAAGGALR
jgi:PQQ-dependent catabolism-associated CXXCW motif protein